MTATGLNVEAENKLMNIRYTSNVNLADIKAIYAHHFDRQQVYAIDLAPEIISPFKFALDLAAQIDQNLFNDVMQLIAKPFVTKSYESQADIWVDMEALGENSINIDCDVIQADGGTRTASITGACVALVDAINSMIRKKTIKTNPLKQMVAAISVSAPKEVVV